jgi:hypothetical protein
VHPFVDRVVSLAGGNGRRHHIAVVPSLAKRTRLPHTHTLSSPLCVQLSLDGQCRSLSAAEASARTQLLGNLPFVAIDSGTNKTTSPSDLARVDAVIGSGLSRAVQCVGPDGAPLLGMFCRSVPTLSADGITSSRVLLAINLANSTVDVTLRGVATDAVDLRTQANVQLPLIADPLAVHLLLVQSNQE